MNSFVHCLRSFVPLSYLTLHRSIRAFFAEEAVGFVHYTTVRLLDEYRNSAFSANIDSPAAALLGRAGLPAVIRAEAFCRLFRMRA